MKSESFSLITPCSSAISARVEISSLLKTDFLSDLPAILLKNLSNHKIPEYLKIGIIDIKVTVVILANLSQYLAPIVLGIISERINTKTVITADTNPIKDSSVT